MIPDALRFCVLQLAVHFRLKALGMRSKLMVIKQLGKLLLVCAAKQPSSECRWTGRKL